MTIKVRLKMKNRSHRYDINRPRQVTVEAQLMKKLSNTDPELKESVAYKKSVYIYITHFIVTRTGITLQNYSRYFLRLDRAGSIRLNFCASSLTVFVSLGRKLNLV